MLLGIAYHAALSFSLGSGWVVEDAQQSKVLYLFQAFVHGFRMPLFMILSGFFTAMLWRKQGLRLVLRNRFQRVFLPCLIGLFTVAPATNWVADLANRTTARQSAPGHLPIESRQPIAFWRESADAEDTPEHSGTREAQVTKLSPPSGEEPARPWLKTWEKLTTKPVFSVLWFLWFLIWLFPLFWVYATVAERRGWKGRPHPLAVTQRSLIWLVPLTALAGWFMKAGGGEFGPDTSMGLIPMPHVLLFYAVFYGFGVLYFECDGAAGQLGRSWRWSFPVSLLVVLPIALEFTAGTFGLREKLLPDFWHHPLSVLLQALYAWTMSFAWMGMFRAFLTREQALIRYLSDASFWFYLAHLPLVILLQAGVREWALPAIPKFLVVCLVVSITLLLSYHSLVRNSCLGRFLIGHRKKASGNDFKTRSTKIDP